MTDNKFLRQLIVDELDFDPAVNSTHIGVAVENGIVTLSGHVGSYIERYAAEAAVRRVKGVKAIVEGLTVTYGPNDKTRDEDIAARALNVLSWHASIPKDAIQVKVQNGWVTLSGTVGWQYQKELAESSIRMLSGVVSLSNEIKLKSRVEAQDIKKKITDALKRSAEVEANAIEVVVDKDHVTLRGEVRDWNERSAVKQAAWATPGVNKVEDRLVIA